MVTDLLGCKALASFFGVEEALYVNGFLYKYLGQLYLEEVEKYDKNGIPMIPTWFQGYGK